MRTLKLKYTLGGKLITMDPCTPIGSSRYKNTVIGIMDIPDHVGDYKVAIIANSMTFLPAMWGVETRFTFLYDELVRDKILAA